MFESLLAHRDEFARALRNFQFEPTDDGRVLFPQQGVFVGGVFTHNVNGADIRMDPNLIVNQGLNDLLGVYFANSTNRVTFYIAPYSNNVVPVATLTGTGGTAFATVQGETTNYTQATRPTWTQAGASSQTIGNDASPAQFTIGTGGIAAIYGAALLTGTGVKADAASTVLVACSAFASARLNLLAADTLSIQYDITATST
ncbi:hypothetical protein [Dokdonella soli]|uniref:Uncharacterized protein n=1 Tax=Dokdonella soli TaxID=529810 RepID=A0ABN1IUJ3_9GAMM